MDKIMENQGLWQIRNQIFGYMDHKTLENCRKVFWDFWDDSLEKIFLLKFFIEFGNKYFENKMWELYQKYPDDEYDRDELEFYNICDKIPGWGKAAENYGTKASVEDLKEIKESLQKLLNQNGYIDEYKFPIHEAGKNGSLKLMEFLLTCIPPSYNINGYYNYTYSTTPFLYACKNGHTEVARLLIKSSKEYDINVNARGLYGMNAFHETFANAKTETAKMLLEYWQECGIDLEARDNHGKTPLDELNDTIDNLDVYSPTDHYFELIDLRRIFKECLNGMRK